MSDFGDYFNAGPVDAIQTWFDDAITYTDPDGNETSTTARIKVDSEEYDEGDASFDATTTATARIAIHATKGISNPQYRGTITHGSNVYVIVGIRDRSDYAATLDLRWVRKVEVGNWREGR